MGSCADFGKLYAYFLEVCRHFIYKKLYQELRVPELGQEMYEWLNRCLSEHFEQSYDVVLNNSGFLSEEDRDFLLPEDRIIDTTKLDVSMHFKIMRLLEPRQGIRRWKYIASVRNYLCHIPVERLQQNMDQDEFNNQLFWITKELQYAGVDENLLDRCRRNILLGRQ